MRSRGSLAQNSYQDFANENVFVPTLNIAPTDKQYEILV
jgi:hypothetical protein